jgi:hypothetical protein
VKKSWNVRHGGLLSCRNIEKLYVARGEETNVWSQCTVLYALQAVDDKCPVLIQTNLHNEANCTLGYTKHMRGVDCSDHYIASSQFMKRIKKNCKRKLPFDSWT